MPIEDYVTGGIHGSESIDSRPSIQLFAWQVIEIDAGTRHFVGYDLAASEGRASTPIAHFDMTTRTGTTASGRLYKLIGKPGRDADARYVWKAWARANRVKQERDVTSEYR